MALFTCINLSGLAQAVDQFTALQSIGEGSVFRPFWGIQMSNGTTTGEADSPLELKFEMGVPDRGDAFELIHQSSKETVINCGFGWLEGNHLTKPSIYFSSTHSLGYVFINGMMYQLKGIKDPTNITSFNIEKIYVLMEAKKGEHLSGKAALKEMKTRNHEETIKQYLSEMKAIQEKATEQFTDDEKNQLIMRDQAKRDKKAGVQAKNVAYWNSEEGQRKLAEMKQPEVTLWNDTALPLYVCYGSGAYAEIKPGSKMTFSCTGGKVYRGTLRPNNASQYDKTDNLLLDLDGKNCGSTVNASGVIK